MTPPTGRDLILITIECEYVVHFENFDPSKLEVKMAGPRSPYLFSYLFSGYEASDVKTSFILEITPLSLLQGDGIETFILSNIVEAGLVDEFGNEVVNDES